MVVVRETGHDSNFSGFNLMVRQFLTNLLFSARLRTGGARQPHSGEGHNEASPHFEVLTSAFEVLFVIFINFLCIFLKQFC